MTRRNLACASADTAPTSSSSSVPRWASWKRPSRSAAAPVNEPLRWPKNSLSHMSRGTDAQFTRTNGPAARGERACSRRARSSFPVPDSPRRSTVESVGAADSAIAMTRFQAADSPTGASASGATALRRYRTSRRSDRVSWRAIERHLERLGVGGLEDVVAGARLEALHRGGDGAVAGQEHHRDLGPGGLHPVDELEAVRTRHLEVAEDDVHGRARERPQRFGDRGRGQGLEAAGAQDLDEGVPHVGLVLHDEHAPARRGPVVHANRVSSAGSFSLNTAPPPSREATLSSPACCLTIEWQMESPRPVESLVE